MASLLLQDWTTVSLYAYTGGWAVTQSAASWTDLLGFDDILALLDVAQVSASMSLSFQTAPSKNEASFLALRSIALAVTTQPAVIPFLAAYGPRVGRYLRWNVSGTSGGNTTFRIRLAAKSRLRAGTQVTP